MNATVEEKIEVKVEKKLVINEEKMKVLAENLNGWGVKDQEPYLKEGFTRVSSRLLEEYGYLREDGSLRLCFFIDLINQAHEIVENSKKYLGSVEPYFLDEIFLPDDKRGVILLTQNEDGKMSIKHPMEI